MAIVVVLDHQGKIYYNDTIDISDIIEGATDPMEGIFNAVVKAESNEGGTWTNTVDTDS